MRLNGQGRITQPIADGQAATADIPSKPVLPVTAWVGTKPVKILSSLMSSTEAGVLEVWMELPNLYDGDQLGSLMPVR